MAGLAAGYSARRLGIPFLICEKSGLAGGNCRTFDHNGFRFDSGAHRLHDRDGEATRLLASLLGDRLRLVGVPSRIYHRGQFLAFPLKVRDVAEKLGWPFLLKAGGELLAACCRRKSPADDFAARQRRNYGPTLAGLFLLNYTEKLWGMPAERLSTEISGSRLQGLDLAMFIREAFLPAGSRSRHLEGFFYYPDQGIGAVSEALARGCGGANVRTGAEIGRVFHGQRRIRAVEIKGGERIACAALLNSIPLERFLRLLEPPPPAEVRQAAAALAFRQLALVALFLNRESVTPAATIYFPDPGFPFTRVYEPKNRCPRMAPPGKTSLVAEIPYSPGDALESMTDERLVEMARSRLAGCGLIEEREVQDVCVRRLDDAYPVLEKNVADRRRAIFSYLDGFRNLKTVGRCGTFRYLHLHDLLPGSARAIGELWTRGAVS